MRGSPSAILRAKIQHDQPADDGKQRVNDMLDPHDGGAAGVDAADGADQFLAFAFGQSARNLVEQQQSRTGCERARHFETLALEQGQRAGENIGPRQQMRAFEDLAAVIGNVALALATAIDRADQQIFEHRQILERLRDLIRAPDAGEAALDAARARVMSCHRARSCRRSGETPPAIRLNSEVLPAPLGPTMPSASPACSDRSMLSAATTEPKDFETP